MHALSLRGALKMKGFDEFMNVVITEAEEVYQKKNERKELGEFPRTSGSQKQSFVFLGACH